MMKGLIGLVVVALGVGGAGVGYRLVTGECPCTLFCPHDSAAEAPSGCCHDTPAVDASGEPSDANPAAASDCCATKAPCCDAKVKVGDEAAPAASESKSEK